MQVYEPSEEIKKESYIKDWKKALEEASKDPIEFWHKEALNLRWFKPFSKVLDDSNKPFYKWFVDGKINIVYNALDIHSGKQKDAFIYVNENLEERRITYKELNKQVNKLANAFKQLGIKKGDKITIYMPMLVEAIVAMLASAKIGAIHSVVYAGFSKDALKQRILDADAKLLITSNYTIRRGKKIDLLSIAREAVKDTSIEKIIIYEREQTKLGENELSMQELMKEQSSECKTEVMDAEDPLFILYTSGTTGKPKGCLHVHGGYSVGITTTFRDCFNINENDIWFSTADIGWITGHSYTVYAPLILGITTIIYEGAPDWPDPGILWKIIEKYKVTKFYTSPTLLRHLLRFGDSYVKKYDLSSLKILGTVGEPINPEVWLWYYEVIGNKKCPIIDTWWQTETGMFLIAPLPVMPLKPGSCCKPFPGIIADVVDKQGNKVAFNEPGYLVIKTPWPAMFRTIYGDEERYLKYWQEIKGCYTTGDLAKIDKDGYFFIIGRSDDVIKVAGHRIGTAELESVFVKHHAVAESAVIGIPDPIKGEVIKAFVVLKQGYNASEELKKEIINFVRDNFGHLAVIKDLAFVDSLPKTRSGKIMRRLLKARELGLPIGDISTLAD